MGEKRKHANIKFWGKQLREGNKEQNKSDGGCTEACKLFRSTFIPQSITLMRNQHDCDIIIVMLQ